LQEHPWVWWDRVCGHDGVVVECFGFIDIIKRQVCILVVVGQAQLVHCMAWLDLIGDGEIVQQSVANWTE